MYGIKICGTGSYLPDFVATNDMFSEFLDTSDEWIFPRTGIKQRHIATEMPNFCMAAEAAKKALDDSGLKAEEIDMIIVSTCTPDFLYPSMSCLVQKKIGAVNAAAIDVNSACTGFITALDTAHKFLASDDYKNILIVASEHLSAQLDYTDRAMCILFGDGAGAAVMQKSDKPYASYLAAQGDEFEALYCHVPYKSNCPFGTVEKYYDKYGERFDNETKRTYLQSDGHAVYKFAIDAMPKAVNKVCEKLNITTDEIDLLVPHQANIRIINKAVEKLKFPEEKVFVNIQDTSNISSACIPVGLDELRKSGKLHEGMRVCLVGFGAGLTYGSIIFDI